MPRCHHAGTPAPFALTTYDEVKDHAEMVAEVLRDQRMPPWYADPKYGHFLNDPGMTADEATRSSPGSRPIVSPATRRSCQHHWPSRIASVAHR